MPSSRLAWTRHGGNTSSTCSAPARTTHHPTACMTRRRTRARSPAHPATSPARQMVGRARQREA
eukprot:12434439-Alexandrium_andersonii.AAC.1